MEIKILEGDQCDDDCPFLNERIGFCKLFRETLYSKYYEADPTKCQQCKDKTHVTIVYE